MARAPSFDSFLSETGFSFGHEGALLKPEDFMTWPMKNVDPWNRMSALEHDCILLAEFSEIEGPKPALLIPSSPGLHFDPNDFSVWLLTADYQLTNRGPFSLNKDMQMYLHNEEQGIYTYAHYFTLFDIEARGFVRPFCVSYLTREEQNLKRIFEELRKELLAHLRRVKMCNRRQFLKELTQALDTLNNVENQTISSYYGLYYDASGSAVPDPMKAEKIHFRTRKVYRELDIAYRALKSDVFSEKLENPCGSHLVEIDHWIFQMINGRMSGSDRKDMRKDIKALCACVYDDFCLSLRHLWSRSKRESPFLRFLVESDNRTGVFVNLDTFPLMALPPQKSKRAVSGLGAGDNATAADRPILQSELENKKEETNGGGGNSDSGLLVSVLPSLNHLIFPLITGRLMLICSSEIRRPTAQNLLRKLRRFIPTDTESAGHMCRRWHEGRVPPTAFADYRLFGVQLGQTQNVEEVVASNIGPYLSILDLNADVFHSCRYRGRILHRLNQKSPNSFPTDQVLIPYVIGMISEYAMLAYVLYYLVYSNHEVYRRNSKYVSQFAEKLGLETGDMKVIRYLVELLKHQDQTKLESSYDVLFLENEPSKPFKL